MIPGCQAAAFYPYSLPLSQSSFIRLHELDFSDGRWSLSIMGNRNRAACCLGIHQGGRDLARVALGLLSH